MTFGEKLQKLRSREGLSQDALAELLNVSRQAVSRWERDETMPETESGFPRPPGPCRTRGRCGTSTAFSWPGPWPCGE